MADGETVAAASAVVKELARNVAPSYNPPELNLSSKHAKNGSVFLPGSNSDAKKLLELELSALASRIKYLEERATVINHEGLPHSPEDENEPFASTANENPVPCSNGTHHSSQASTIPSRQEHISSLLAKKPTTLSEGDLMILRNHVQDQAAQIQKQHRTIAQVKEDLDKHQLHVKEITNVPQNQDLSSVHRELRKHQMANEAFQKALKEIGTIVTAVANGDLNQKVLVHPFEMDPEIATFKKTINTMIDQLMIFGNEVSRVAREVGTEGRLGGQAHVEGVSGIWEDLTNNGKTLEGFLPVTRG